MILKTCKQKSGPGLAQVKVAGGYVTQRMVVGGDLFQVDIGTSGDAEERDAVTETSDAVEWDQDRDQVQVQNQARDQASYQVESGGSEYDGDTSPQKGSGSGSGGGGVARWSARRGWLADVWGICFLLGSKFMRCCAAEVDARDQAQAQGTTQQAGRGEGNDDKMVVTVGGRGRKGR